MTEKSNDMATVVAEPADSTADKNRRILIIDDTRSIHDDFRKILSATHARSTNDVDDLESTLFGEAAVASSAAAYELDSAYQGEEGLDFVKRSVAEGRRYALAFIDMRMPPGWDGVQTIEAIWKVDPEIQVVICTAYSDYSWEDILKRFGSGDRLLILKKPFDTAEVCQLACALTEKWQLAKHAHLKLSQLNAMVQEQTKELAAANHQLKGEIVERRRSEDRYALAAAAANDGLWEWDIAADKMFYSMRWKAMLGYAEEEISARSDEWMSRLHLEDAARVRADLDSHLQGRTEQFRCEYRIRHRDGQYRWMLCRGLAVRDGSGAANCAAGSQADITDRKMAEQQLRHDAFHDSLTGLGNRALLTERLDACLARIRKDPGYRFAVLFLDLDRFKVINDSLGHVVGDQLLVALSRRLADSIRTVPGRSGGMDQLARLGGDEFVVLLDGVSSPQDPPAVAERLRRAMAEPFHLDDREILTCASIGIAVSQVGYERAEDILRDADTALYQAKADGRGCSKLFDPSMHTVAVARWQNETDLRHAIDRDELCLHFQPIRSIATGELVEFEALVRWQRPDGGLVPPSDFIPLAEETGLIIPLGCWVIRNACRQLKKWLTRFPELSDLAVGVNVSGKQFAQSDLLECIKSILAETGIKPQQLKLEITENSVMEDATTTMAGLTQLRELNLEFHMDDFGTGYSSLSYLHKLPIDSLKIDRSFVTAMQNDTASKSIVLAIVALGHSLDMLVIAEGVETAEQFAQLKTCGCDFAQGFYFSRPMPAENLTDMLAAEATRPRSQVA